MSYWTDRAYDWVAVERALAGKGVDLTDDDLIELARRLQADGGTRNQLSHLARCGDPRARRAWEAARTERAAMTPDLLALIALFMFVSVVLPLHYMGVA